MGTAWEGILGQKKKKTVGQKNRGRIVFGSWPGEAEWEAEWFGRRLAQQGVGRRERGEGRWFSRKVPGTS